MDLKLERTPAAAVESDALVLLEFEGRRNPLTAEPLKDAYDSGEIRGKALEMTLLHRLPGTRAARVLVAGAGKSERFNAAELRKLAGAAARFLKGKSVRRFAIALDDGLANPEYVSAAAEGAILGDFEPDRYKTEKDCKPLEQVTIAATAEDPGLQEALERGRIIGESQNFARDLANEPPNRLTPLAMSEAARKMAEETGLECEVLDRGRMQQLGMGALLGVAQGSAEPPVLIILRHKPEGTPSASAHLGLIGKGVTFDTGGISIKPSEGMEKMKYDMAGGAAVIGAMRAIALLKAPIAVTALIPAVENMPGGKAQRPGDIVKTLSGKTVEVLNTDAEGRLILADALTYAKHLGCTHLVDAATLTGSIVVALGTVNAGVFANEDSLFDRWMNAATAAGEKMWRMPLDDEYKEQLKSVYADIPNIGGRQGGSITAALFLQEFADGAPWLHLDIAGTAWLDDPKPYMAKGPSGLPVRSFVNLAMNWKP